MLSLMVDAGLRCCEVSRLTWDDVDLVAGTLHVTGKGQRDRVVGIPARLRLHLAALDTDSGRVIELCPTRVSTTVGEFLRSVGVNATAHQLRHTYATRI